MRPDPLVDLESLDLSKEFCPLEDFREVVKQRGRFALIDGVLVCDTECDVVVGYKEIRSDDWWTSDHIPGRPIFPGTLMVEASAQLCTFDFVQRRPEQSNAFVGFTGIDNVRFRMTVEPGCRLYFVGVAARIRRMLFNYRVQGIVDGKVAFDGSITGMVV